MCRYSITVVLKTNVRNHKNTARTQGCVYCRDLVFFLIRLLRHFNLLKTLLWLTKKRCFQNDCYYVLVYFRLTYFDNRVLIMSTNVFYKYLSHIIVILIVNGLRVKCSHFCFITFRFFSKHLRSKGDTYVSEQISVKESFISAPVLLVTKA